MSKTVAVPVSLDMLTRKLAQLAKIAPEEVKGVELLVDDALARHQEDARTNRLTLFSRVK
jgi:hypothetical protein